MIKKDLELAKKWAKLRGVLRQQLNKRPKDLNEVLFIIGVQELGKGMLAFSKEEKQDLMHIAICKVLSFSMFYELNGLDDEGWPHWKAVKPLPHLGVVDQEKLLKWHVIEYFEQEMGITLA